MTFAAAGGANVRTIRIRRWALHDDRRDASRRRRAWRLQAWRARRRSAQLGLARHPRRALGRCSPRWRRASSRPSTSSRSAARSPSTSSSASAQMVVLATGGMNLAVGSIGVCVVMAGRLPDAGRSACRSRSPVAGGAGARRLPRLAQRLRHRPHRRQQLHRHAGERQPLLRRHADPDQGRAAQRPAARRSAPSAGCGSAALRLAAAGRRARDRRRRSSSSTATRRSAGEILAAGANARAAEMSGVPVGRGHRHRRTRSPGCSPASPA